MPIAPHMHPPVSGSCGSGTSLCIKYNVIESCSSPSGARCHRRLRSRRNVGEDLCVVQPTGKRIALWVVLVSLWVLLLPQDLAMDPGHEHFSWVGAVLWLAVLVWLVTC